MIELRGPGSPFTRLFDEQTPNARVLPDPLPNVYSAWPLPDPAPDRPFTFVNFVMSHDGRVSFNVPKHAGGNEVSRNNAHDRWLMGLLRARADAILVGGSSIAAAGNHVWTPQAVFPEDADAWVALRAQEQRAPVPTLVVLTRSGSVPQSAPALDDPHIPVLIATTAEGERAARSTLGDRSWVRYLVTGATLDQIALMRELRARGVAQLLVEGGPQIYGALLRDNLIDDEFVTLSPIIVGRTDDQPRPSLIEGVAFGYEQPPQMRVLSVHRVSSHLFLHSRYDREAKRG